MMDGPQKWMPNISRHRFLGTQQRLVDDILPGVRGYPEIIPGHPIARYFRFADYSLGTCRTASQRQVFGSLYDVAYDR